MSVDRWTLVAAAVVVLVGLDARFDEAVFGVAPPGGRTWPVVALAGVLGLGVVTERRRVRRAGERLAVRLRAAGVRRVLTVASGVVALLGVGYVALSAVVLLPLAEAPGYSLAAVYTAVGRLQGPAGLAADLAWPLIVCAVLALALAVGTASLAALRAPWPWAAAAALASWTPLVAVGFLLGFSFGTDVPDALPPGVGVSPLSDAWFLLLSQAGLLVAVGLVAALLPAPRQRAVTAAG